MRAIAILLVVCAHAGIPWLAGGFVGVDVFFVLSGYLITGLLLREFELTRKIDFIAFYARRLQRLLPGLLLMVACTVGAAMVLLAPFEQLSQVRAAAAAATWTSNFLFAFEKLDYFGPAADTNLFLHTWSLGVEEQFYLLWPAWVLFLLGAWAWQGDKHDQRRLTIGMAATVVVCLALSVHLTYTKPQLGFYMVFSRGWQFALGALAFLHFDGKGIRCASIAGWLGFAAILVAAAVLDERTSYPGVWALLPSLGTALVLVSDRPRDASHGPASLLGMAPLQAIGRVSYSWYLWHWPVLLLGTTLVPTASGLSRTALALVSLLLATVAYLLVESPVRRAQRLRRQPRVVLRVGLASLIVAAACSIGWSIKATAWSLGPGQQRYVQVRGDLPAIYAMGCDEWYHSAKVKACGFGSPDAKHTTVLMGDSVAGQWFPAVRRLYDRPDWRLIVLTKSSCPMVDQPFFYARIGREYTECEQWRNSAIAALPQFHPDVVLFSSYPTRAYSLDEWREGSARVIGAIARSGARIGVLAPTPLPPFDGPACLARREWRNHWFVIPEACVGKPDDFSSMVRAALESAVARHPQARLLDLSNAICPQGKCLADRDGTPVYRDGQHLTASFAASLAPELGQRLEASGLASSGRRGEGLQGTK